MVMASRERRHDAGSVAPSAARDEWLDGSCVRTRRRPTTQAMPMKLA
jgi:hypothetical protein